MDLALFGIQGSGKGTQGKKIADKYNLVIFETGAELRKLAASPTQLGEKVKSIIESGRLVSTEVVMEIIENFLHNLQEGSNVLFDGIPRSLEQMEAFNALMEKNDRSFMGLHINISKEEAMNRLLSRRICKSCKTVFPASYANLTCDNCGGEMTRRADDNEESIKVRLETFTKETLPVIEQYNENGQIIDVDGTPAINEVTESIFTQLNKHFN